MTYITTSHRRRMDQRKRENLSRILWTFTGQALLTLVMAFLLAWFLINWMMGCGETFHGANGQIIMGECVSITLGAF